MFLFDNIYLFPVLANEDLALNTFLTMSPAFSIAFPYVSFFLCVLATLFHVGTWLPWPENVSCVKNGVWMQSRLLHSFLRTRVPSWTAVLSWISTPWPGGLAGCQAQSTGLTFMAGPDLSISTCWFCLGSCFQLQCAACMTSICSTARGCLLLWSAPQNESLRIWVVEGSRTRLPCLSIPCN